jgi:hypothetical protein
VTGIASIVLCPLIVAAANEGLRHLVAVRHAGENSVWDIYEEAKAALQKSDAGQVALQLVAPGARKILVWSNARVDECWGQYNLGAGRMDWFAGQRETLIPLTAKEVEAGFAKWPLPNAEARGWPKVSPITGVPYAGWEVYRTKHPEPAYAAFTRSCGEVILWGGGQLLEDRRF